MTDEIPLDIDDQIKLIISGDIAYVDFTVLQQAMIYESLLEKRDEPPETLLLAASQISPHEFTYVRGDINCPMDRNLYKVKPHHLVMVSFEQSSGGYSRAQAGLLSEVMDTSLIDPTVTIVRLPESLRKIDTSRLSKEKLQALLLEDVLEYGGVVDIGIDEKHRLVEEMKGQEHSIVTVTGEVRESPSTKNDGVLLLTDRRRKLDIDMSNIRLLHVIGVNIPAVKMINPLNN